MEKILTYSLFESSFISDIEKSFISSARLQKFNQVRKMILSGEINTKEHQDIINYALWLMIDKESKEMVVFLVKHGADINYIDKNTGKPSIIYAAEKRNQPMVNLLLDLGADINKQSAFGGNTVLSQCMLFNQISMVIFLLENGADPSIKNNEDEDFIERVFKHRPFGEMKKYDFQKEIFKYYPKSYKTFKKYDYINPLIKDYFPELESASDLNLL